MINPLFYYLNPVGPWDSAYALANIALAIMALAAVAALLHGRINRLLRPGMLFVLCMIIFYQLPLAVFAPQMERHLPGAVPYACALHGAIFLLLLWVRLTDRLTVATLYDRAAPPALPLAAGIGGTYLLAGLLALIYFAGVPWNCAPLYIALTQPEILLLMREVSGKLAGAPYAGYATGILNSVVIPAAAFFSMWCGYRCLRTRRWFYALPFFGLILFFLLFTLIGGAKGNLIPSIITLTVGCALMVRQWVSRIAMVSGFFLLLLILLVIMELIGRASQYDAIRRLEEANYSYDNFGVCVMRLGACEKTHELFTSLRLRDESLGLRSKQLDAVTRGLEASCPVPPQGRSPDRSSHRLLPPPPKQKRLMSDTVVAYANAVVRRAFVVPFQVSAWHYMYVAEHGRPGPHAAPLAKFIHGASLDMPRKVYQAYGSIYSGGDRTSTSTAPTGYLFTYSAYFGLVGWLGAMALTVLFDLLFSLLIRKSQTPCHFLAIGLAAAACLNLIITDFFTVFITHGMMPAMLMLSGFAILSWLYRRWRPPA